MRGTSFQQRDTLSRLYSLSSNLIPRLSPEEGGMPYADSDTGWEWSATTGLISHLRLSYIPRPMPIQGRDLPRGRNWGCAVLLHKLCVERSSRLGRGTLRMSCIGSKHAADERRWSWGVLLWATKFFVGSPTFMEQTWCILCFLSTLALGTWMGAKQE